MAEEDGGQLSLLTRLADKFKGIIGLRDGKSTAADPEEAQRSHKEGDRVAGGRICFNAAGGEDGLEENLYVSDQIFTDKKYTWNKQWDCAKEFNKQGKNGVSNWRPATDQELEHLFAPSVWKKVAPDREVGTDAAPWVNAPIPMNDSEILEGVIRRPGFVPGSHDGLDYNQFGDKTKRPMVLVSRGLPFNPNKPARE